MKALTKFVLLFAVVIFVNIQNINAQSECKLTNAAKARQTASTCFANLANVIACLSQEEQNLWAKANADNTDETRCFKCDSAKSEIKTAVKGEVKSHADTFTNKAKDQRRGVGCFKSFEGDLDSNGQTDLDKKLNFVVSNQLEAGKCQAALLKNVGNLLIKRKRLFCAKTSEYSGLVYEQTQSKIDSFKFNSEEASSLVDNFLTFFECQSNQAAAYANGVQSIVDTFSNSNTCKKPSSTLRGLDEIHEEHDHDVNDFKPPGGLDVNVDDNEELTPLVIEPSATGEFDYTSSLTVLKDYADARNAEGDDTLKKIYDKIVLTFNGVNPIKCNPSALNRLISQISNDNVKSKKLKDDFKAIRTCETQVLHVVTDGSAVCHSCEDNTAFTLAFKDSKMVASKYYLSFGCNAESKDFFIYAQIQDLKSSDVSYSSILFRTSNKLVDSNFNCNNKLEKCVPGSNNSSCNKLNDSCKKKLDDKCKETKLTDFIETTNKVYPPDCDYVALGLDRNSDAFINACAFFLSSNFLEVSLTFHPENLAESNKIVESATQAYTPPTRILQGANFVIDIDEDPTTAYTIFNDVVLTSSDVSVDGSTPDTTATLNYALAELDPNSSVFLKSSLFLALVFLLF